MATVAITGKDTIKISNRILNDLADGDNAHLTFPNDISAIKVGKNGNAIYALNQMGQVAELDVRVLKGSSDDMFLNQLMANQNNDFAGTPLIQAEVVKNIGDGTGAISPVIYVLLNGMFKKNVETSSNVEGNTEQAVSVYHLHFAQAPVSIG